MPADNSDIRALYFHLKPDPWGHHCSSEEIWGCRYMHSAHLEPKKLHLPPARLGSLEFHDDTLPLFRNSARTDSARNQIKATLKVRKDFGGRDCGSSWPTRITYLIHSILSAKWLFSPMQSPRHKIRLSLPDYISGSMASQLVFAKCHIIQIKKSLKAPSCWVLELQSTEQCMGSTPSDCDLNETVFLRQRSDLDLQMWESIGCANHPNHSHTYCSEVSIWAFHSGSHESISEFKVQTHYEDCKKVTSQSRYLAGTPIQKNIPVFEILYKRKPFGHIYGNNMGYFCPFFFFNYVKPSRIIIVINICIGK